jgi:hypothetical protein
MQTLAAAEAPQAWVGWYRSSYDPKRGDRAQLIAEVKRLIDNPVTLVVPPTA